MLNGIFNGLSTELITKFQLKEYIICVALVKPVIPTELCFEGNMSYMGERRIFGAKCII